MEFSNALITDNIAITSLILVFALANILAWGKGGVILREVQMLQDLHNERTFNAGDSVSKLKTVLYAQYFLFFGLTLFALTSNDMVLGFEALAGWSSEAWISVCCCILAPVVWYFFQWLMYHWISFIFGGDTRVAILDRIYKSTHFLSGPVTFMLFWIVAVSKINLLWASILLTTIFIITQIVFIFNGIKIFYKGFGSVCLFFVYLCALEIAPIGVILVKMTSR